jgi:hypothetical protein
MRQADEEVRLAVHFALLPYVDGSIVSASYHAETCREGQRREKNEAEEL